ncbi:MAG: YidC/Oxa1 family membrane protein insertase, partial [Treponema sp.]|nr:YidC/Oxa1 family membrane protein insertase [Treponema sp.]
MYPIRLLLELVYGVSYRLISSEGLSIVAVSLIVNLLMLPIYDKADSIRDRVIAKQKKMAGAVSHIKKSFSGDERFLMLSEYYAQNHYSPLSTLLPSLSILLQVPFFMAAYSYLSTLEGLNGRSFLFIKDLACSDSLIVLPHFTLNVLPIAMTLINCVSGAVYTRGQDFSKKLQVYLLASVFLLLLYNSPSGLVLYWTCNNIFSLAKNLFHKPQSDSNSTKTMKAAPLQALIKDKGLCHRAFALSCLLLFLLTGLAIPSALISSSATEFASLGSHPNPLYYVFNCCLQSAGFTLLWPICIYLMFGSGVQAWLALTAGVLALSASTNSYAFMPAYGDISSSLNFLNSVAFKSLSLPSLVNILVLLIITASICLLIQYKNGKPYILVLSVLCLAVSFLSLVNIKTISKDYQAYRSSAEKSRVSDIKPLFHLSRNHPNVLLIMLDRAQPQYVAEIFREDPSLEKSFDG